MPGAEAPTGASSRGASTPDAPDELTGGTTGGTTALGDRRFAMTVDVEDYFQVWAFSGVIARSSWDGFARRVGDTTRRALDMFDAAGAKATFFALGWVAEREPRLMREIVERGHELASHGYDHAKAFDQTADEFRADVKKAKSIIEDASGAAVNGYRAPGFSFDARTPFAYEALAAAGYAYSSSLHPIAHDHYGDPTAPRSPFRRDGVLEAPVATASIMGRRLSAAGGGWFRASPYPAARRLLATAARQLEGPVVFYFHPWEIDPEQPRITSAPAKSRLRHYLNLGCMQTKLERLLRDRGVHGGAGWGRLDVALGLAPADAAAARRVA